MTVEIDPAEDKREFDEAWYLRTYPDVAGAVERGDIGSGWVHFLKFGKREGRRPNPELFDPGWYRNAYPLVSAEAASGDDRELRRHYLEMGRYRGYLPNAKAARPKYAERPSSSFGGLWIDAANALDLVAGKKAIGQLSSADAKILQFFIRNGYVKLNQAIPPKILDRATKALEKAYRGEKQDVLFECHAVSSKYLGWDPGVTMHPAKVLDLHWGDAGIRNLIFSEPITHFLELIFERPILASQTLGFYRGSAQPMHQDSAYVSYSLPQQFCASWIALEDVELGAGELEYFVGSHKSLPEFVYTGGVKNVSESIRLGENGTGIEQAKLEHQRQIVSDSERLALTRDRFIAKRGEVLFWHADLAHGGTPISLSQTRKSVVTHYCPCEVAPLFLESTPGVLRRHGEKYLLHFRCLRG